MAFGQGPFSDGAADAPAGAADQQGAGLDHGRRCGGSDAKKKELTAVASPW
jgi:hypothetical protein